MPTCTQFRVAWHASTCHSLADNFPPSPPSKFPPPEYTLVASYLSHVLSVLLALSRVVLILPTCFPSTVISTTVSIVFHNSTASSHGVHIFCINFHLWRTVVKILAPLFGGDGLAVVDLLLAQPELEMRLHAVELLSSLLVHKKVNPYRNGRGWIRSLTSLSRP